MLKYFLNDSEILFNNFQRLFNDFEMFFKCFKQQFEEFWEPKKLQRGAAAAEGRRRPPL